MMFQFAPHLYHHIGGFSSIKRKISQKYGLTPVLSLLVAITVSASICGSSTQVRTLIIPRSQCYSPQFACLDRGERTNHVFISYEQSWRPDDLAEMTLSGSKTLWQGSQVINRNDTAFQSDNLGLSPTYKGALTINPQIQNTMISLYHVMDLSRFIDRLFVTFLAPLVYSRWNLNICESIETFSDTLPAGYQSQAEIPAITTLRDAFTLNSIFGDNTRGITYQKIPWNAQSKTSLAGFLITCGRHLIQNPLHRWSWYGQFNFSSSNTPKPQYLFNPIIGNGHFLEIGLGVEGWSSILSHEAGVQLKIHGQGAIQYLIKNTQLRTFDWCTGGPLSRYQLLKLINPSGSYGQELLNSTYATTYPVFTQRPIQGQFAAKLAANYHEGHASIGYQLYGIAAEKIDLITCQPTCVTLGNRYGIKGDLGAYAYDTTQTLTIATIPLNTTSSESTIISNASANTPQSIPNSTTWYNVKNNTIVTPGILAESSKLPALVSPDQLNIDSGRSPSQITHSIFIETGYRWNTESTRRAQPSLLIGGFIEIVQPHTSGIALWGAWIRAIVDF